MRVNRDTVEHDKAVLHYIAGKAQSGERGAAFSDIQSDLWSRFGGNFRALDRSLQRLRKRGLIQCVRRRWELVPR